ncbi:MAG: type II secretion system protein [Candidatus Kerfeldbacteria bacterium]|nr:type II secretion system protein [Candidatus Kerfeldbacteria bacterium]
MASSVFKHETSQRDAQSGPGERHDSEKRDHGFTLVEILVVVAVFSITMLVAVNIFLITTRSSRRAALSQKIQGDVRFAVEAMAREVRYGTIDYDCYSPNPGCDPEDPTHTPYELNNLVTNNKGRTPLLALRDVNGNRVRYKVMPEFPAPGERQTLRVCLIDITRDSLNKCDDPLIWEVVTPEDVSIVKGEFYLHPFVNPFQLNPLRGDVGELIFLADAQPRVTIVLRTQQTTAEPQRQILSAQTTVMSRLYAR